MINPMNLIRRPQLSRRQFLKITGLSSMSFLLGGCGTPLFEGVVGKLSEPLNEKVEAFIFNPQKPVPEFSYREIQPEALLINTFRYTPIIDHQQYRLTVDGEVNNQDCCNKSIFENQL
jgi:DMSO/TMAO reductase YedYZ molybdopterin-dependent catalytic subunit